MLGFCDKGGAGCALGSEFPGDACGGDLEGGVVGCG